MNKSQTFRHMNSDRFIRLQNGKWGGFRKGVQNGPDPSTPRGKRRNAK